MAKRPTVLNLDEGGPSKMMKKLLPVENDEEISSTSQSNKSDKDLTNKNDQQMGTSRDTEETIKGLIEEIRESFVACQGSLLSVTEVKRFLYGSAALQLFLHKMLVKNPLTKDEDIQLVAMYLGLPSKGVSDYLDEMYPKRRMLCTSRYC